MNVCLIIIRRYERFVLCKSNGYSEKCDKFVYLFCPNTGTKFREPYHSNHVILHRHVRSRKTIFSHQKLTTYKCLFNSQGFLRDFLSYTGGLTDTLVFSSLLVC